MKKLLLAVLLPHIGCHAFEGVRPYTNECHPDRFYPTPQDTTPDLAAVQAWCKAQREGRN